MDVDGILVRGNKVKVAIEIKWKETLRSEDVSRALKSLEGIDCDERFLITKWPLKETLLDTIPPSIKVLDAEKFINFLLDAS